MPSSFETLVFEIIAKDAGASAAFDKLRRQIDQTSASVDKSSASLDKNTGTWKTLTAAVAAAGPTAAVPALTGAGVALGGVATAAVAAGAGLVAFGGFALPAIMKVKTALTGPGGLVAAWGTLDNSQRGMALGLQALLARYRGLATAMDPVTLRVFNSGLALANSLLGPTAKLAASAGAGLSSFLRDFTAGSGIQRFVSFLATQAGPAIALLGHDVTGIAHAVFTLLQSFGGAGLLELQALTGVITALTTSITWLVQHTGPLAGVAISIGGIAFALSKLGLLSAVLRITGISTLTAQMGSFAAATAGATLAERGLLLQTTVLEAVTPWGWALLGVTALGALTIAMLRTKSAAAGYFTSLQVQDKATGNNIPGLQKYASALSSTVRPAGELTALYGTFGHTAGGVANAQAFLADKQKAASAAFREAVRDAGPAAVATYRIGTAAQIAAASIQAMYTWTKNLMTAQSTAVATQLAYGSAILTSANDAVALEKGLDASHGKVGLLSAAQRNSLGLAQTYIGDLSAQATQAFRSGHGVDAAMTAIRNGLPLLDSAKTKNKQYWQEVQTLVTWLDRLQLIKAIHEAVFVTGSGTFTIRPGTTLGLPGGSAGGPFAAGGYITQGTTPTADNVLARVSKGELIVPAHMVAAGLADHLRGRIPGFAAGGLVPSYGGNVAGLVPWSRTDLNATVGMFGQAVAKATLAGMKAAALQAAQGPAISGGGGPAAALFQRMYPAWASGALWAAVNYVAMRESGWSTTAVNPSSGAAGVAQRIQGWAPFYQPGNAFQQDMWFHDYLQSRYGGPIGAAAHERAFNWYDGGGWLYPGKTLAVNTTGAPERVTSPAQEKAVLAALARIEAAINAAPDRTGRAVGGALSGATQRAALAGRYSSR